ncbi:MAG TPA: glycosyltransferase family 1 protein [Firmicutes bacterium]|nr:glycosyltransferase family 1 protein [Bacillota bacterium]
MRVAWDLQAVTGPRPTGLGIAVGFLLDACRHYAPDVEIVELRPNEQDRPLKGVPDRLYWEQLKLPRMIARVHRERPLDLCYSPALGAPLKSPVPVVANVNDLIPLVYPQSFSGFAGWYWKRLLPRTWRASRGITVSNATVADDIVRLLRVPRTKIHIVPYYPDPQLKPLAGELRQSAPGLTWDPSSSPPLFITMASHEPRKNIELAISAVALLHGRGIRARLTCAGGRTTHTETLATLARKHGLAEFVDFPGYVERREAVRLMLSATALIFASRYEGYGLPPLEAMTVGCPVVLSDIACHHAVYGEQAKWDSLPQDRRAAPRFVDPDDAEGLAEVLVELAQDEDHRRSLVESGFAYSALFTPEATAGALARAFSVALAT